MDEHNEDYHLVKEEIRNETDENGNTKIIIMKYFEKKNKYAENIKKANKAYHERNKETINKKIVEWQKLKYQNDPEYREKMKEKRREYYKRKKIQKTETE
jgi:hypothetical protein